LKTAQYERMSGPLGDNRGKDHLRSSVSIPKWMDCIEFGKKTCKAACDLAGIVAAQILTVLESAEHTAHLRLYVLRITEHAPAFRDSHGAKITSPNIDILKEMAVYGPVVRNAEPA